MPTRFALGALALGLTAAAACSRSPAARPQSAPASAPPAAADTRRDPVDRPDVARDDRAVATGEPRTGAADPSRATLEAPIYFDFDRSDLTADARNALAAKLAVLLANPGTRLRIVGHADERGSDEYNLALGLERAAAAKRYLTQRGVPADLISVISMGEEQPVCGESTESCWWRNRRDEFVVESMARASRP